jgi:hypothetical protein
VSLGSRCSSIVLGEIPNWEAVGDDSSHELVHALLDYPRSSWHSQFIGVSSDGDEFGRGVQAAGERKRAQCVGKVTFTVAVAPVIAGHAPSESP